MSYNIRWRKAIALSVFLHIFLGVAVGYMTVKPIVLPPDDEQIFELDMGIMPGEESSNPEPQIAMSAAVPEASAQEIEEVTPLTLPDDLTPPTEEVVIPKTNGVEADITTPVISNGKASMMGTPPIVLEHFDAINPPELARIGRKVIVVLRMRIMENGMPGKVEVAIPSGEKSINDAAVAAAKKWRFEPAKDREGHPVVCSTILSIPFIPK